MAHRPAREPLHRGTQAQEPTLLPALPVQSQRVSNYCLTAETIAGCAKALVKIQPGAQTSIPVHLINACAKDHTLHNIRRTQPPRFTGKQRVMRDVNLTQMIKTARLPGKWQLISAAPKFNLKRSFTYVNIRRAILPHRTQLYQVSSRANFLDRPQHVQIPDNIVMLGKSCMRRINHRISGGWHLRQVHNRIWLELFKAIAQEHIVQQIALPKPGAITIAIFKSVQSSFDVIDRNGALPADFLNPFTPQKCVNTRYYVAACRAILSQRPSQIAINPRDQNLHKSQPHLNTFKNLFVQSNKFAFFNLPVQVFAHAQHIRPQPGQGIRFKRLLDSLGYRARISRVTKHPNIVAFDEPFHLRDGAGDNRQTSRYGFKEFVRERKTIAGVI